MNNATATAHMKWDQTWKTEEGRAAWSVAEPDVMECIHAVVARGGQTGLDLGCGIGRHALAMAEAGMITHALDGSAEGLDQLDAEALRRGLDVVTRRGPFHELPYGDGTFDYVLTFNVIYHGDPEIVRAAIAEMHRTLKPGGTLQLTMLTRRNRNCGIGREVAPGTFVQDDATDDKVHPHFYCNAAELVTLLDGFDIQSLVAKDHKPGMAHWHWHCVAERL